MLEDNEACLYLQRSLNIPHFYTLFYICLEINIEEMKNCFVLFVFVVCSSPLMAQHLLVGPKAGLQTTRAFYTHKEYYEDYKSKLALSYHVGAVLNVKVSEFFSLQTEVLYNQTAKKLKGTDRYSINTERYHNISVPLLLRASFGQGQQRYYFNVGPNISYWLGGSGKIKIPELLEGEEVEELQYKIKFGEGNGFEPGVFYIAHPNRLQLGLDVGAGVMVPMMNKFLMVDVRYTWANTYMAKDDTPYMNFIFFKDDLRYTNHVLSLSVAYLFDFDIYTMLTKGKSKNK